MLQLKNPNYDLPEDNVFKLRNLNWEDYIIKCVTEILKAGEQHGIHMKSISLEKDADKDQLEIKRTISRLLNVDIAYGDKKELTLSYDIPWLVDNHFYIGGNKKVSIYQLFDRPVIQRDSAIKIRTNIHTLVMYKRSTKRNDYNYYLSYSSREIPFAYYILALKGIDEVKKEFGIDDDGNIIKSTEKSNTNYFDLMTDLCKAIQTYTGNEWLASFYNRKTDSEIIENLMLISDVDIFSRAYLQTGNIIDEFSNVIRNGTNDDLDYSYKRLRFAEQLVFTHLCKDFYNMIVTIKKSKRSRFKCNSKAIITSANKSPIVQYDFSLNPLGELAMLSKVSLTGPGGFDKDNVPTYLRDINPSIYGRVCPADTGDRENCGTSQYLVPVIELDDNMNFVKSHEKCINSIAISHVPLLEHDDPTRLQMASSQQRHAIMLREFDNAYVQSGIEGMYTDQTSFMFRAKRDGKVMHKDANIIIVQYDNNECKAFNVGYKKLYLSICDLYNCNMEEGQEFKKGDIIAESNYLKSGRLNIGKNLKTAVMVYNGYNYEDGIVISDALTKPDGMTSIHYLDLSFEVSPNKVLMNLGDDYRNYKPLPQIGDSLSKGDLYAKIKTITGYGDSHDVIFDDAHEKRVSENCIIADVKIYANKWNKDLPQYREFVQSFIDSKKDDKNKLIDTLSEYLTKDELEVFLESSEVDKSEKRRGYYKMKGDSIDGIRVEITAIYERPITIGDKIGNRHGNKGVISKIIPQECMPTFPDGSKADVIINPLGIISRMNIGQLFELHLSYAVHNFKNELLVILETPGKKSETAVKNKILEFVKLIDKTEEGYYYSQVEKQLSESSGEDLKDLVEDFYVIQPPFESIKIDDLRKVMEYTNTEFELPCYDPMIDPEREDHLKIENYFSKNIQNEISFGYMYFIKMNHIAKDKISSRSVGPYTSKTCQPIDGKSRKGGQRLGEMEVWAVAAHGATANLSEMLTTKSDSIKKRNALISHIVNNNDILIDEEDSVSQSNRLFQSMLRTIGLDYPIVEED